MIDAFYSGRDYAPLWLTNGVANDRAKSAMTFLAGVAADGLDPSDYPVPNFKASSDPAVLAENELQLTNSVLTFAHHAQMGRVHWSRVSADISYTQTAPEPADVLADMVGAKDVGEALDGFNPQHPGYKALKAKLAEIRGNHGEPATAHIAGGAMLKVGMQDARVPQLRERLGVSGDGNAYDKALAEAVKKFQQQHKINADRHADHGDRRRAQRQDAGSRGRHHHRQHGALALAAAKPRQDLCDGQHSRFQAARDE